MTSLSVKFILAAIPACTSMQKISTLNERPHTSCETKQKSICIMYVRWLHASGATMANCHLDLSSGDVQQGQVVGAIKVGCARTAYTFISHQAFVASY